MAKLEEGSAAQGMAFANPVLRQIAVSHAHLEQRLENQMSLLREALVADFQTMLQGEQPEPGGLRAAAAAAAERPASPGALPARVPFRSVTNPSIQLSVHQDRGAKEVADSSHRVGIAWPSPDRSDAMALPHAAKSQRQSTAVWPGMDRGTSGSFLPLSRQYALWLTAHPWYDLSVGVLIILNMITICWEVQSKGSVLRATSWGSEDPLRDRPGHFLVLTWIFCLLFVADILFRIYALRWAFIIHRGKLSKGARWHIFDTICVIGYIAEVVFETADLNVSIVQNLAILRIIRMARMIRIFNVLRTLPAFRTLRVMVTSIFDAIAPFVWFCIILCLVMLLFGVVFTTAATEYIASEKHRRVPSDDLVRLEELYGSLPSTVAALFRAITGGDDWLATVEPLQLLGGVYVCFFYSFIAFSVFAIVNVGSAIFLDAVLQRSKHDRDYVIDAKTDEKKSFMRMMDNLFSELDRDMSGQISLEELREHLDDHKVSTFLSALNLDVKQVALLFRLMDANGSGTIDRFEFRDGCDKLRGEARQLDLAILGLEVSCCQNLLQEVLMHLESNSEAASATSSPSTKKTVT